MRWCLRAATAPHHRWKCQRFFFVRLTNGQCCLWSSKWKAIFNFNIRIRNNSCDATNMIAAQTWHRIGTAQLHWASHLKVSNSKVICCIWFLLRNLNAPNAAPIGYVCHMLWFTLKYFNVKWVIHSSLGVAHTQAHAAGTISHFFAMIFDSPYAYH